MTYSHMGPPTLPSAQLHFTSEFGMGSGGSTTLLSLGELVTIRNAVYIVSSTRQYVILYSVSLQNHLGVVWLSLTGN